MKEIKKTLLTQTLHRKTLKLLCKIKKNFQPAAGYKPRFPWKIIAKLLCDDNLNADICIKLAKEGHF